jgi:formate dehydrogenase major subunit
MDNKEKKTVSLSIDNKKVTMPSGSTIVEAAEVAGIKIPTLCHVKELKPFTSCFICVVEIKGARKLEPACSTAVVEGMEVFTNTKEVRDTRKVCIELLLSEHNGDCLSPCHLECPASCDIQGYLQAIAKKDNKEAVRLIKETIILPASIGRVCPRPCESVCRREKKEGGTAICSLKRFAADEDLKSNDPYIPEIAPATGKKVAIIGAGPGGVNAAFYLTQNGHSVTIFEAQPQAGGMMQYGIPQYRLPKELLQKEISNVLNLGVEIKYNTSFGTDINLDSLRKDGYEVVLFAIGAQKASSMRVDGEDTTGVISGIDFLEKAIKGEDYDLGKKVVVVGGGNTAIDAARTSWRMGADVSILYRRTKKEMPAEPIEIHEAELEGIKMEFLKAPVKIRKANGKVVLECIKMKLGEPDSSGRCRPVMIEGSEYEIEADTVISAIGQKVDVTFLKDTGIKLTDWDTIVTNNKTGQTNIEHIFAAGDCVLGPFIIAAALGQARIAAISIDQYLKGQPVIGEKKVYVATMGSLEDIPEEFYKDVEYAKRYKMPKLEPADRANNFDEVEVGYNAKQAVEEASICLECGCKQADNCVLRDIATEYDAVPERWDGEKRPYFIDRSHPEINYESSKCILCGRCVRYSNEVKKTDVLGFTNRGIATSVKPAFGKLLKDIDFDFAKELAEICPTGAISLKTKKIFG